MTDQDEQKRAFFRLRYPLQAQPRLVLPGESFAVAELSEQGMRLVWPEGRAAWPLGQPFKGELRLRSQSLSVEGEMYRDDGAEKVLRLHRGLEMRHMVAEQKDLFRRFPALYGRAEDD